MRASSVSIEKESGHSGHIVGALWLCIDGLAVVGSGLFACLPFYLPACPSACVYT